MPFKKLEVNRLTTDCTIKVQIIQRNKLQTQKFCIVWIKEQSNNKQSFSVCQACSWEQLWHDYRVETLDFKKYGGSAIIIGVANLSFNECVCVVFQWVCMCSLSMSVYVFIPIYVSFMPMMKASAVNPNHNGFTIVMPRY